MSEPKINPEWPPPRPTLAPIALAFVLAVLTFVLLLLGPRYLDGARVTAGLTVVAGAWALFSAVSYNRAYDESQAKAQRNKQVR